MIDPLGTSSAVEHAWYPRRGTHNPLRFGVTSTDPAGERAERRGPVPTFGSCNGSLPTRCALSGKKSAHEADTDGYLRLVA
jgi:hypothetical protein